MKVKQMINEIVCKYLGHNDGFFMYPYIEKQAFIKCQRCGLVNKKVEILTYKIHEKGDD